MRWAEKVKQECEAAGFRFVKREDNGHWEMLDGGKMIIQSRALGDVLRRAGNEMGISV